MWSHSFRKEKKHIFIVPLHVLISFLRCRITGGPVTVSYHSIMSAQKTAESTLRKKVIEYYPMRRKRGVTKARTPIITYTSNSLSVSIRSDCVWGDVLISLRNCTTSSVSRSRRCLIFDVLLYSLLYSTLYSLFLSRGHKARNGHNFPLISPMRLMYSLLETIILFRWSCND